MEGKIWLLTRSLQLTFFQAYKLRVTHLFQLKQHSILVSVGQDEHGINPLVSMLSPLKASSVDNLFYSKCSHSYRLKSGTLTRETAGILCALGFFLQFPATNPLKFLVLAYMKTSTSWALVRYTENTPIRTDFKSS